MGTMGKTKGGKGKKELEKGKVGSKTLILLDKLKLYASLRGE